LAAVVERTREGNDLCWKCPRAASSSRHIRKIPRAYLRQMKPEPPGLSVARGSHRPSVRNISAPEHSRRAAIHRQHFPLCAGSLGSFPPYRPPPSPGATQPKTLNNTDIGEWAERQSFDEEWVDHFRACHITCPRRLHCAGVRATFAHLTATTNLIRRIVERAFIPRLIPGQLLGILDPLIVGASTTTPCVAVVKSFCNATRTAGHHRHSRMKILSDRDSAPVGRARKSRNSRSHADFLAAQFTRP